jgi:hypothetical protein
VQLLHPPLSIRGKVDATISDIVGIVTIGFSQVNDVLVSVSANPTHGGQGESYDAGEMSWIGRPVFQPNPRYLHQMISLHLKERQANIKVSLAGFQGTMARIQQLEANRIVEEANLGGQTRARVN